MLFYDWHTLLQPLDVSNPAVKVDRRFAMMACSRHAPLAVASPSGPAYKEGK